MTVRGTVRGGLSSEVPSKLAGAGWRRERTWKVDLGGSASRDWARGGPFLWTSTPLSAFVDCFFRRRLMNWARSWETCSWGESSIIISVTTLLPHSSPIYKQQQTHIPNRQAPATPPSALPPTTEPSQELRQNLVCHSVWRHMRA